MMNIHNKYLTLTPLLLLALLVASIWKLPAAAPMLGIVLVLTSLGISILGIFEKHKGTEKARSRIWKDVAGLTVTILLILFLGGLAALLAHDHVSRRFGMPAGWLAAIAASFIVGYLIRWGAKAIWKS
jgi:hypothetical protein